MKKGLHVPLARTRRSRRARRRSWVTVRKQNRPVADEEAIRSHASMAEERPELVETLGHWDAPRYLKEHRGNPRRVGLMPPQPRRASGCSLPDCPNSRW